MLRKLLDRLFGRTRKKRPVAPTIASVDHARLDPGDSKHILQRLPQPSASHGSPPSKTGALEVGGSSEETPEVVEITLRKISDIATLPEVTVKVIELVEDPQSTADDLHEVIKHDPALSAKILKLANSAFYGLPGHVSGANRAIAMLGLSTVKNLTIAASISRMFKGGRIAERFTAVDLWHHSLAVGVACRLLTKQARVMTAEECFVAGLMHDVGVLVERQALPDRLNDVVKQYREDSGHFLDVETQILGANHQQFGLALTTHWKFPPYLRSVCGFHHDPEKSRPEFKKLGYLVRLADILCCREKIGFFLTADGHVVTEGLLDEVGVTQAQVDALIEEFPLRLEEAEAVFSVSQDRDARASHSIN